MMIIVVAENVVLLQWRSDRTKESVSSDFYISCSINLNHQPECKTCRSEMIFTYAELSLSLKLPARWLMDLELTRIRRTLMVVYLCLIISQYRSSVNSNVVPPNL